MGGDIQVLHVDSDPDFVDLAATVLEREDERLSIETATSTRAGLEALAGRTYDCVVADYDMPERDGIEFLAAVREESPDLPFVLFTGKGSEDVASDAISAGVSDYLQKGGTEQFAVLANRITNLAGKYRAEQAQERYRILVEEATDVILVVDADATIQFATPSAEAVLGRTPAELADTSVFESVHPDDRGRMRAEFAALADSPGERRSAEFRYERADGSTVWLEARGRNLLDAPVVDGIVIYARDVDERVQRERDLERYETIVENTEDGIYVFDAGGRFEFVNRRAVEVSGIPREDWIGRHVSVLVDLGAMSEDDLRRIEESIDAIVSGESDGARIEVTPDVPHELRVLEIRLTPFPTDSGTDHVVGFSRDVTERKEYEHRLEEQNERLEEFTEVVSHDLRNPLTVAEGRLELARETGEPEHLEDVAKAHDRIRTLIEDLLAVAREGETAMSVETVPLPEVVETCWSNVETSSATLVPEAGRTIRADRGRLQQLLENLMRNAVEHGPTSPRSQAPEDRVEHSEKNVTVTVGDLDDGFYVADDGPGIPEDAQGRVFEAGYSTAPEGTGFGLAIVAEIADAHGWEVAVTDSAAGGARFEITGVDVPDSG